MDVHRALPLLAGLSPAQFMRRHWQKKPLLVRAALPGFKPLLSRSALFKLAGDEAVESRLIVKSGDKNGDKWEMRNGPFATRSLPPISRPGWSLLVQGVDGHDALVHQLLQQFRFVPDARLDDVMVSIASPGGGVGPHFDSYDVFLFQASGRRRWKIGQQKDLALQTGVPLKILQNFKPEQEFVLEAGDMLYLPPRYAHDGVAELATGADGKAQDCMTYSIGFKAPVQVDLAAELLHKLAEFSEDASADADAEPHDDSRRNRPKKMYLDPDQPATPTPAEVPAALVAFAADAVRQVLQDPLGMACALGEIMTAPKAQIWFGQPDAQWGGSVAGQGLRLDAKSRMMYDANHVFINGESYRAKGRDAHLMRLLADQRALPARALTKASTGALDLLAEWHAEGWLHGFTE